LAAAGWVPGLARAQAAWPAKPVHLHVTFAPGGVTDAAGRLLAEHLTRRFGQTVVVENRPGAAGNIGAGFVAKSEPDGYNLVLVLEGTIVFNPHLYDKMTYDPVKDLVPVGKVGDSTIVFVAHPSAGVKNLQEAIALSRARSGGLSYATAGAMTITHIVGEMMKQRTNAEWLVALREADLPHGPANSLQDLMQDEYLNEIGFFPRMQHPSEGEMTLVGIPVTYQGTPATIRRLAPRLLRRLVVLRRVCL
jgi:tripartite-type tricarboxylate transporter receptor subunit TctC